MLKYDKLSTVRHPIHNAQCLSLPRIRHSALRDVTTPSFQSQDRPEVQAATIHYTPSLFGVAFTSLAAGQTPIDRQLPLSSSVTRMCALCKVHPCLADG